MTEADSQQHAIRSAIASHLHDAGPLLPILHAIQDQIGWVPEEAVATIAEALNLSVAEVHGVISFYHDFRQKPPGQHVLKICRAEACQAMGASRLVAHVQRQTRVELGETRKDGRISLDAVYCLGLCASGPAVMADGRVLGRVNSEKVDALLEKWGAR